MSSRIEELIDEIETYFDECRPKLLSKTEVVVNREAMEDLLSELRARTPEEIKRYQKIISNKEAIIADARAKAEALIAEATATTNQLINEHEIMQRAYAQANEVVQMASSQAQEILDNAMTEANTLRSSAAQYMDDVLAYLEEVINGSISSAVSNYESLLGDLNHYKDIIQSNRSELHPVEDMIPQGEIANLQAESSEEASEV